MLWSLAVLSEKRPLDMKVYCLHKDTTFTKSSNFYQCHFCNAYWYGFQPTPLVAIGSTDPYEASPDYAKNFEPKDLSKKKFVQCNICKDLVEKRKHVLCSIKLWFKTLFYKLKLRIKPK